MTTGSPRALVYSPFYFPTYVGGGERLAQLTAAGLRANRIEVAIVTAGSEAGERVYDDTAVYMVRQGDRLRDDLRNVIARHQPDFVHMVGSWTVAEVGQIVRESGVKFGVAGLDYGQFCDNHLLVRRSKKPCGGRTSAADCFRCSLEADGPRDRWLARLGSRLPPSGRALIQRTGLALLNRPFGRQLESGQRFVAREMTRSRAVQLMDLFIAPTRFAVDRTAPHLAPRTVCHQLMYPVADELLRPEPKHTRPNELVVGFVGRCLQIKGLHILLDAAARLDSSVPLKVRIETATNDGEERPYGQALKARAARMPSVQWSERGVLDATALRDLHASLDVLAVPSLWPEYVGFVTLEALALGTRVLLSDFPTQRELLTSHASGEVVRPGDSEALAAALAESWVRKREHHPAEPVVTAALSASEYARRLVDLYAHVSPWAA